VSVRLGNGPQTAADGTMVPRKECKDVARKDRPDRGKSRLIGGGGLQLSLAAGVRTLSTAKWFESDSHVASTKSLCSSKERRRRPLKDVPPSRRGHGR